jgi:hypothetical protein
MKSILEYLNLLAALASAFSSLLALKKPGLLSRWEHFDRGTMFYIQMYAARAVPLGILSGTIPFWADALSAAAVVFSACLVQVVDVAIALVRRDRRMIRGASAGALIHAACCYALLQ